MIYVHVLALYTETQEKKYIFFFYSILFCLLYLKTK